MRRPHNLNQTVSMFILSALLLGLMPGSLMVRAQNDTGVGVERATVAGASPSAKTKAPDYVTQRFEKDGIVINFSVKALPSDKGGSVGLVSGANAIAAFRLTDARTGQPIKGLHPAAWISASKSEAALNEAACKDKIRLFMGGLMSGRADIDLNTYLLLTLNHDNTLTFTNPQASFSISKLESIIPLPGPGADWALAQNKQFLIRHAA